MSMLDSTNPDGSCTDGSGSKIVMLRFMAVSFTPVAVPPFPPVPSVLLAPPSALVTTITYSLAVSPSCAVTRQVTRFSPICRSSLPLMILVALSSVHSALTMILFTSVPTVTA